MAETQTVKIGRVVSVDDKNDYGRILVHIKPDDDIVLSECGGSYNSAYFEKMKNNWSWPLLPKHLHIQPKVDEYVLVITAVAENKFSQRYYIGPVIPQLSNTTGYTAPDALSGLESSKTPLNSALQSETYGTTPSNTTVSVIGRGNSDIQITTNDIRLRAGIKVFDRGGKLRLNTSQKIDGTTTCGPGIFKLKYDDVGFTDNNGKTVKSTATIVADRINLIGNNPKIFELFGDSTETQSDIMKENLIPDEEMKKILEKAHVLPYGDVLVEYLKLFAKAFITHTHSWVGAGCTPVVNMDRLKFEEFNPDTILSDNVRII